MQDRVPRYAGRLRLVSQSGQYYTFERADDPSVEGTPINKNTLLKDSTAAAHGLGTSATVDDVLAMIAEVRPQRITGFYTGTGTYGSNNPNTLTFSFKPSIVLISRRATNRGYPMITPYIWGESQFFVGNYMDSAQVNTVSVNGNTMSWYASGNSAYQLNQSGDTYDYCAIG